MTEEPRTDLDLLEMPLEGLAAYWLSLKKIMGAKLVPKTLQEEAEKTSEPFIRYMLELCVSGLDDIAARRAGTRRRETVLRELSLKMSLMREALLSMSAGENPRLALIRMFARVPGPVISEENATKMALDMVRLAEKNKDGYVVTIGPALSREELLIKLMFYVLWARREGVASVEPFSQGGRCRFFVQGVTMAADGLDRSVVKSCLDASAAEILVEAGQKMDLALDMALALRAKTSYEDMFRVAQAYLP